MGFNLFNIFSRTKQAPSSPSEEAPAAPKRQLSEHELQIFQQAVQEFAPMLESYAANKSPQVATPVAGGRSSVEPNRFGMPSIMGPVQDDFPFQILPVLENLAMFNRHISYAVDNIVNLANTECEIFFADTVRDAEAKKMKQHLKEREKTWYQYTDGESGLWNDLFAQLATFGALSAEGVPFKNLTGIEKVVRVAPFHIRFAYDEKKDMYIPLQQDAAYTGGRFPGYRELNLTKYMYLALRRYKNIPYGVPPMASALEDLITENDMIGGFKTMMKRLGMLGFLSVLVTAPEQDMKNRETNEAYKQRLLGHLQDYVIPMVDTGLSKGYVAGYKGTTEFNVEGNQMNTQGAEQLLSMVKSLVFAGVKQDPNMLGENRATTETFGRVILAKMTTQTENYQRTVAAFRSRLYYMELVLAGFNPGYVQVVYKKPLIGDQKREAETETILIDNVVKKRNEGLISQDQAAMELGYDKPHLPGPMPPPALPGEEDPGTSTKPPAPGAKKPKEGTGSDNPTPDKKKATDANALQAMLQELRADAPVFAYAVPEDCMVFGFDFASEFRDARLERYIGSYNKKLSAAFATAVNKAAKSLKADMETMPESTTADELADAAVFHLLKDWKKNFVAPQQEITESVVPAAYRVYRKDKSVFTGAKSFQKSARFADGDIPEAVFNLLDVRAIEYLGDLDDLYLGKFITDPDTIQRVKDYIHDVYLEGNKPIGRKSKALDEFINNFEDAVTLERWKIRRIVETTLNKVRNYANVNYIAQADVEEFEIVEIMDRKTCSHCTIMNGKIFSTEPAVKHIERVVNGKPEDVSTLSPFATTIKAEDLKTMTSQEIQLKGISTPSYHPHCRGRVVAVF